MTCSSGIMTFLSAPDSKAHGAKMGPIWGRQDPGGPHVGPMNFALSGVICTGELGLWHVIAEHALNQTPIEAI